MSKMENRRGDAATVGLAGAQLAEILALSLIERGLINREEVCAELEALAMERREDEASKGVAAALIQLANSLRAGRAAAQE